MTVERLEQVTSDSERSSSRTRPTWARIAEWMLPVLLVGALQVALAFREPIFSPVDELAHTDYVRSIAVEGHPPIFGQSTVDRSLLGLLPADQIGSGSYLRLSYEALQFPAFYLVAAPIYRVLAPNPRLAIYALRLFNVILSLALLVIVLRLLRTRLQLQWPVAAVTALAIFVAPGPAVRSSQVTNQVLASLLIAVLLLVATQPEAGLHRLRRSLGEAALLAASVLVKLTALGALPALLLAWHYRPGGIRRRAWAGLAGFAAPFAPWLAWSLPVYGSPLPWTTRHPFLWNPQRFAPPNHFRGWLTLLHDLIYYFWRPFEWSAPPGAGRSAATIGELVGTAALGAGIALVVWQARRPQQTDNQLATRVAATALAGFLAGYILLAAGLHRVYFTDLREAYVFMAPLVLVLGVLSRRLGTPASIALLGGLSALWLVSDFGFFVTGTCVHCPT